MYPNMSRLWTIIPGWWYVYYVSDANYNFRRVGTWQHVRNRFSLIPSAVSHIIGSAAIRARGHRRPCRLFVRPLADVMRNTWSVGNDAETRWAAINGRGNRRARYSRTWKRSNPRRVRVFIGPRCCCLQVSTLPLIAPLRDRDEYRLMRAGRLYDSTRVVVYTRPANNAAGRFTRRNVYRNSRPCTPPPPPLPVTHIQWRTNGGKIKPFPKIFRRN